MDLFGAASPQRYHEFLQVEVAHVWPTPADTKEDEYPIHYRYIPKNPLKNPFLHLLLKFIRSWK